MTCAMPSRLCMMRGTSCGYFVFHSEINLPSGFVSMTEKRRIIGASSMARISSIDCVVPIEE